jgi:multisubunit Na+/H+ antiporter MnhB subunit
VSTAQRAAREVSDNPVVQVLGRLGMVCYGIVHVLLAGLTAQVVLGDSGEQTDQKSAVASIADTSFGPFLLWVLAIGLFFFALWQLVEAAVGYQWIGDERKRLGKRIGATARAITGVVIGVAAVKYASGSSTRNSSQQQEEWTAKVLALPGGQFLVGAVAIGVLVIAFIVARKGVKKTFEEDLNMSELPAGSRRWVERLGRIGWIGKGLAYAIIGLLVGIAAINADPQQSGGLDKALHTLAAQPYGVFLLAVIAVGFLGFGVYCFAAARAHKG